MQPQTNPYREKDNDKILKHRDLQGSSKYECDRLFLVAQDEVGASNQCISRYFSNVT